MKKYCPEPRPIEDMDVVGDAFAVRFTRNSKHVELYIEEGGSYHFKAKFDREWLIDLINVAVEAEEKS